MSSDIGAVFDRLIHLKTIVLHRIKTLRFEAIQSLRILSAESESLKPENSSCFNFVCLDCPRKVRLGAGSLLFYGTAILFPSIQTSLAG